MAPLAICCSPLPLFSPIPPVTDLAGVQGAHQEAATAEEGVVAAEAAGADSLEDAIEAAWLAEAPVSCEAFGSAAGP